MKNLLILVACLFALAGCNRNDNAKFEYSVACEALQETVMACGDLPAPAVEYFNGKVEPNLMGYYEGEYTIYISDTLSLKVESSVKFHEIIHYLQVHRAGLEIPGPARQICAAEAMAFKLTDIYRERIGLSPIGSEWWRPYWYCWPYYAPAGSEMAVLKLPTGEIIIELIPQ